jgi:phenylacetate-CoA ligase
MAQTCLDRPPVLHVNSERVVLRVVRQDGRDAAAGEQGQVVMTHLRNAVMPFINYALGDLAVAGRPCPCGRGFPTIEQIEGRTSETLRTPAGKTIAGGALCNFLMFGVKVAPRLAEFQAVQVADNRVVLRVVPGSHFNQEFAGRLRHELERFLGPGMEASVETVDRLELERSGKRLLIKSNLPTS